MTPIRSLCSISFFKQTGGIFLPLKSLVVKPVNVCIQNRCSNNGNTKTSKFTDSEILLQDGVHIQELPIIVRKTNDVFTMSEVSRKITIKEAQTSICDSPFEHCKTIGEVFSMLNSFHTDQVSAEVAYQALKKIADLRQMYAEQPGIKSHQEDTNSLSFALDAILLQLVSTICRYGSSLNVVESLKFLVNSSFPGQVANLQSLLAEECLQRILDGRLSVRQVCEVIQLFQWLSETGVLCGKWIDKSWVGLLQRSPEDIDEHNVVDAFKTLPYLKESRRAVFIVLERRFITLIYKLSVEDVLTVLDVVKKIGLPPRRLSAQISRWLTLVLHTLTEDSMRNLILLYSQLDYFDTTFGKCLERYVKAKSSVISDESFVLTTINYCRQFRFRSVPIFNTVSEFFIKNSNSLNCSTIEAILITFGCLYYQPTKEYEFWSLAEEVLEKKLVQFTPHSFLDVVLSCTYLQRYPMNFVPRLFSSYFLHRLYSQPPELVELSRLKLKLFDVTMSLECSQYGNRMLPKDHAVKSLSRDGRINRLANSLIGYVEDIVSPKFTVTSSVILTDLPLSDIYIIDLLISPAKEPVYYRYGYNRPCAGTVAVLIHPPEHFTNDKSSLVGIQLMRNRHLFKMGFNIVNVDYENVSKMMCKNDVLEAFLKTRILSLLPPC